MICRGENTGFPPQPPIDRPPCFPHYSPSNRACPLLRPSRLALRLRCLFACLRTPPRCPCLVSPHRFADRLASHSYYAHLSPVLSPFSYLIASCFPSVSRLASSRVPSRLELVRSLPSLSQAVYFKVSNRSLHKPHHLQKHFKSLLA